MADRKELLDKAIEEAYERIGTFEAGSKEEKNAIDNFVNLYKIANDEKRIEFEEFVQEYRVDKDAEIKMTQIREENRRKWFVKPDTIVACGTIIAMTIATYTFEGAGGIPPRALRTIEKLYRFV